jgi:hypothetical protein
MEAPFAGALQFCDSRLRAVDRLSSSWWIGFVPRETPESKELCAYDRLGAVTK